MCSSILFILFILPPLSVHQLDPGVGLLSNRGHSQTVLAEQQGAFPNCTGWATGGIPKLYWLSNRGHSQTVLAEQQGAFPNCTGWATGGILKLYWLSNRGHSQTVLAELQGAFPNCTGWATGGIPKLYWLSNRGHSQTVLAEQQGAFPNWTAWKFQTRPTHRRSPWGSGGQATEASDPQMRIWEQTDTDTGPNFRFNTTTCQNKCLSSAQFSGDRRDSS